VNYIYIQHLSRKVFSDLQNEIAIEESLDTEWGKLQIEHSTFAAITKIETKAKNELNMSVPTKEQIIKIIR